jgi:hypothetical protein
VIRWLITACNFVVLLIANDVFFLLSGETLLTRRLRGLEFRMYRLLKRWVVISFVGADIRSFAYLVRKEQALQSSARKDYEGTALQRQGGPISDEWQQRLIRDSQRFADAVLVSTPDLLELVPHAEHVPVTVNVDDVLRRLDGAEDLAGSPDQVVLLHPGHQWQTKGTASIVRTMETVRAEWTDQVKILVPGTLGHDNRTSGYPVTRTEMFALLKTADIVIDQMLVGWYGLTSVEALLAGKTVVCHIDRRLEGRLPDGCPIVRADLSNLQSCLSDLVRWRLQGGVVDPEAQIAWVRANHTLEAQGAALLRALGLHCAER